MFRTGMLVLLLSIEKELGNTCYVAQLVGISGTTARCMERHSKVVLGMKAVFVA